MATFSFDIVSDYDKAEINNVFDQTQREMQSRYDFKGTPAAVEWLDDDKSGLKIIGSGDWQIDAILDIVRKKLAARDQSQKILDISKESIVSNLKTTKDVLFKKGLDQEKAKKVTASMWYCESPVILRPVLSASRNSRLALVPLNRSDLPFPA